MSNFRRSPNFCLICYKTIEISNKTRKKLDNIEKFVKIVTQFAGTQQVYPLCDLVDGRKLLECCRGCRNNIETFCNIYDQIKLQEMSLVSIVDTIGEKIKYGDKLSTRCTYVSRLLENIFRDDLGKRVESQYRISKFRQCILEIGCQKKMRFQPSITINRSENDNFWEEMEIKEEVEEKYSPDEGNIIVKDQTETLNVTEGKKSVLLSKTGNATDNDDRSKSGNRNEENKSDGLVLPLLINSFLEDSTIQIKEEPIQVPDNMDFGFTEENNSTPEIAVQSITANESETNSESIERTQVIQTNGNCEKDMMTTESLLVDFEFPNDWRQVCEASLKKFGKASKLITHLRKNQNESKERRENNEPSAVISIGSPKSQQIAFSLKENRKVKSKYNAGHHKTNIYICPSDFKKMHEVTQIANSKKLFNGGWRKM